MTEETPPVAENSLDKLQYYAAILHSDGQYAVESFETLEALVARLKELLDRDVSVFSFAGTQLKLSKPPFRHLITPWGAQPLFTLPGEELEEDTTGYLGMDPVHFEKPPQIKMPTIKSAAGADEFFDPDVDSPLGVFDGVLPDPDS